MNNGNGVGRTAQSSISNLRPCTRGRVHVLGRCRFPDAICRIVLGWLVSWPDGTNWSQMWSLISDGKWAMVPRGVGVGFSMLLVWMVWFV